LCSLLKAARKRNKKNGERNENKHRETKKNFMLLFETKNELKTFLSFSMQRIRCW
jgi:hypothetical protein